MPWPKKRRDEVIEVIEDSVPHTKKRKEWTNDPVIEVVEDTTMLRTKKNKPRKEKSVVVAKIDKCMEAERETEGNCREVIETEGETSRKTNFNEWIGIQGVQFR